MSAQLQEQVTTIGVRRVAGTLIGDRPVGPTGFASEIVEGKPFLSDADVKVA